MITHADLHRLGCILNNAPAPARVPLAVTVGAWVWLVAVIVIAWWLL